MRDPVQGILNVIERDESGLALIWCPDFGLREWLVDEVESVLDESKRAFRTDTVEGALAEPHRLALLVPNDERGAILDLEANRERLLSGPEARTQPIVLFLMHDADGQRALAEEAVSIASWLHGNHSDPEEDAQIDLEEERRRFEEITKQTPEAWLEAWRRAEWPQTSENYHLAYRAKLLEKP